MRLLVGVDDRDGGRDAIELARVLGAGSAVVVSIIQSGPLPLEYGELSESEALEAAPLLVEARAKLAGVELELRGFAGGSPPGILTTIAEGDSFDAIVVGSPHRGAFGRVMIGSVATSLLNGAPTAVAVAPRGYGRRERGPLRTIAVGCDGSPESQLALKRAEQLARAQRATIEILTVVAPPIAAPVPAPVVGGGAYMPYSVPDPDRILVKAINSVDQALAVEGRRLDGVPAAMLSRACVEGVDLLVLGSRGYGPLARTLLGSTSRELVKKAPCPVLVVARP
jgi:nucleotide-binding universal stress UspA family protein